METYEELIVDPEDIEIPCLAAAPKLRRFKSSANQYISQTAKLQQNAKLIKSLSLKKQRSEDYSSSPQTLETSQRHEFRVVFNQLKEMGFESSQIYRAIKYSGVSTVVAALSFLVKGSQGWDHPFKGGLDPAICVYCRERREDHVLVSPNEEDKEEELPMEALRIAKQASKVDENKESPECQICYMPVEDPTMI